MTKALCKDTLERRRLAVGISFASATLLSLQALHPGNCCLLNITPDQSFALSATLATLSVLFGSLILTKIITNPTDNKK